MITVSNLRSNDGSVAVSPCEADFVLAGEWDPEAELDPCGLGALHEHLADFFCDALAGRDLDFIVYPKHEYESPSNPSDTRDAQVRRRRHRATSCTEWLQRWTVRS